MDTTDGPLQNTMMEALGMEMVCAEPERVVMRMPVGPKVHQPYGLLHGGASVALAESAASLGTAGNIDLATHRPVGMEINANHLRPVKDGWVVAEATVLHKGRTSMVWDIKIRDEQKGRLVCVSRCTVAIVPLR
jgi:uncharacterized protein (TIGR00369 family)